MRTITTPTDVNLSQEEKCSLKRSLHSGIINGGRELVSFAKYLYLVSVMVLLVCAVIELKHIFQVDLFPGIDTPIDNIYYAGKDRVNAGIL